MMDGKTVRNMQTLVHLVGFTIARMHNKVIFTLLTLVQNILLFDNDAALPVYPYC